MDILSSSRNKKHIYFFLFNQYEYMLIPLIIGCIRWHSENLHPDISLYFLTPWDVCIPQI